MAPLHSLRRGGTLLALAAGSVATTIFASAAPTSVGDRQLPDALLAVIEEYRSDRVGSEERARALLRALDPAAAGAIFDLEVGRVELGGEVPFEGALRSFVLDALDGWPAARVGAEIVDRLGAGATYGEAFVALELLGRYGDEASVVALLAGLGEDTLWARHRRFHDAVEGALSGCERRGVGQSQALQAWLRGAPTALLPGPGRFLAGIAGLAGVQATRLLLDRDPDLDLAIVEALGTRDPRGLRDVEEARAGLLRRCLWNGSLARRRQAIASLAALRDADVVPELLEMIDDEEPSVAAAARDALRRIAGTDVGGSSGARWRRWHADELAWGETELPALRAALQAEEAGPAVRALRDAKGHPLHRRPIEDLLVPHISHREPAVAAAVCGALADLDCRGALGPLEQFCAASSRGRILGAARAAHARLSEGVRQ